MNDISAKNTSKFSFPKSLSKSNFKFLLSKIIFTLIKVILLLQSTKPKQKFNHPRKIKTSLQILPLSSLPSKSFQSSNISFKSPNISTPLPISQQGDSYFHHRFLNSIIAFLRREDNSSRLTTRKNSVMRVGGTAIRCGDSNETVCSRPRYSSHRKEELEKRVENEGETKEVAKENVLRKERGRERKVAFRHWEKVKMESITEGAIIFWLLKWWNKRIPILREMDWNNRKREIEDPSRVGAWLR